MSKTIRGSILLLICAVLLVALPVFAQNPTVTAELYQNKASINGTAYDTKATERPILQYMRTLYIPLDENFQGALGLTVQETEEAIVLKSGAKSKALAAAPAAKATTSKTVTAQKVELTVKLNDKEMKWKQPILRYQDVLYLPLNWSIATKDFGWEYTETATTGLVLHSSKVVPVNTSDLKLGVIEKKAKKDTPVPAPSSAIVHTSKTLQVSGRNIACEIVTVDMKKGGLRAETVLAGGAIGKTATLEAAAKANGALFAINGTFFDAYNGYGTPSNVLVSQGKLLRTGENYGALGINGTKAVIDRVRASVDGENTGKIFDYIQWYNGKWYGLSLNTPHIHSGDSRIVIFDRNYQDKIRVHKGFVGYYFTVDQGIVSAPKKMPAELDNKAEYTVVFPATVSYPSLDINTVAKDAKVLNKTKHVYTTYAKFAPGSTFGATPKLISELEDPFWDKVETVVGAGPLLVRGGKKAIDFDKDKFWEEKIKTASSTRSVVGIKADGTLVFVIATGTVNELADVMLQLGAVDATCFDGGGSSGMYLNGKTIWQPGRELSNILIFKSK